MGTILIGLSMIAMSPVEAPRPGVGLSPEKQARLEFVLEGLRYNRAQLHSGIYRISGRKMDGTPNDPGSPRYEGEVKVFCAFDYNDNLFRFDRTEPKLVPQTLAKESKTVDVTIKFIRTDDYSINFVQGWNDAPGEIIIRPPDYEPRQGLGSFDVRMLGIGGWGAIDLRRSYNEVIEDFADSLHRTIEFEEEEDGLYRLVLDFSHHGPTVEWTYWFDENQGFAPIRNSYRIYNPTLGKWEEPFEVTETTWQRIEQVWVPMTYSAIQSTDPNARRREYNYVFEWESVNEELDPVLFAKDAFDESAISGTPKFDRRLGESVLVERVNVPAQIAKEPVPIDKPDSVSPRRFWFLIINGIVLGVIAIGLSVWWLRRS